MLVATCLMNMRSPSYGAHSVPAVTGTPRKTLARLRANDGFVIDGCMQEEVAHSLKLHHLIKRRIFVCLYVSGLPSFEQPKHIAAQACHRQIRINGEARLPEFTEGEPNPILTVPTWIVAGDGDL